MVCVADRRHEHGSRILEPRLIGDFNQFCRCYIDRYVPLQSQKNFGFGLPSARRNALSKQIGQMKGKGEDTSALMAEVGGMVKVSGNRIATPLAPPSPGSTPMITPSTMPIIIRIRLLGCRTTAKP